MESRFEDDLVELAGEGQYLMACRDRKTLFLDGVVTGKVPMSDVRQITVADGALAVELAGGERLICPFPTASAEDLARHADRLSSSIAAWH